MADARPEHLLLAARKIGRERAGIMAGLVSAEVKEREREKEREKERQQERKHAEGIKSPKTPKRAAQLQYVQTPPHALNPGYVFLNNPVAVSFPGSPVRGASSADQHHPHQYQHQVLVPMHHVVHTPTRGEASGTTVDIPTPLDSLVSAARSMMDDGGKSKATNGRARRASTIDVPDSPVPPKRRKVAGPNTSSATLDQSMPESRVRSALDVLADQAAVFSSKGRELSEGSESRRGSVDSSVSINGKGAERTKRVRKASEKAKMALGKLKAADGKKGKGKAKVKTKAAAKGKGKGKTVVVEEEKLEKLEKLDNGKGGDSDVDVDVESEEGDRSSRGRRKEVLPPKLRHEGLRKDSFQFVGKWTARQPSLRPVTRWGEGSPTPVARRRNRELNMDVPASPPANVAEGTGEQMVGGNDGGENDNERVQKTQLDPESSIPMPTSRSRSVLPSPRLDELPLEQEGEAQHTAAPLASYELTLTTPWASLPDTLNLPHTSMALVAAPTNKDNNATQISPPALPLDSSTPPYIHPTTSSRGEDRTEIPLTVADTAASIPPGAPVADADADGEMDADGEVDLDADGDLDDMSEGNSHLVGIGAPEVGSASDTTHSFDHYASGSWEVTGYSKGDGAESAFDPDIMLRGQEIQMVAAGKRPRSPYVKWSKEEDDLLAQVCHMLSPVQIHLSSIRLWRNMDRNGT
jgi:hypothetical protein